MGGPGEAQRRGAEALGMRWREVEADRKWEKELRVKLGKIVNGK